MREMHVSKITDLVAELCIKSNYYLSNDIKLSFESYLKKEKSEIGKNIINTLLENAEVAKNESLPMCQDTGMVVVFLEIGQDIHIVGGDITEAINKGVALGYEKGYLRKSIVKDPIDRLNTKDNTPAVIHFNIVPGDKVKVDIAPKGFGSENASALKMLKPSQGIEGVKDFVIETVSNAGPNACPPMIIGIGVGGNMEKATIMAKHSLLREVGSKNNNSYWASIEDEILHSINKLNIGPGGFGGLTTALAVYIETYPTHIAGLPVAVNISCHATRHAEGTL